MKCPVCGREGLTLTTKDLPYTYKGETIVIRNMTGQYCSFCDEMLLAGESLKHFSDASMSLNKRVNAAIIDPTVICRIRKKLKLTQKEASHVFGGGPNAFSRYETGKALPSPSLITLLRLLDNHPDLLDEIKRSIPPVDMEHRDVRHAEA
ncbi:type II toxin-antitoxin system MqsA family antitoxin [Desulfosarcina sp. OttesenSCG-928-G10]|nr:type II toxin-antitoxin system MqsA family antitoxin [Desulfosarcina sp. OttesenSCG-928-G10]MDL2321997.1 type II toxin-antitoxin system MqsA family antitoxin [Desulfosarcina sp. OttesenSCG-928-B08]